jgi:hypothetical protein
MCEHWRHKAAISDTHTVNIVSTVWRRAPSRARARGMPRPPRYWSSHARVEWYHLRKCELELSDLPEPLQRTLNLRPLEGMATEESFQPHLLKAGAFQ